MERGFYPTEFFLLWIHPKRRARGRNHHQRQPWLRRSLQSARERPFSPEKQSMTEKAFSGGEAIDDDHGSSWRHNCLRRRRSAVHGEAIGESMLTE
ncbi:hypothetical protein PRUPE_8G063000 [Prunus persica]|uniref:Uncharacterized protein n=1 Tax=Prunus persica TaxID=3760 RepID=A0A251MU36_PRUPE|nr:hypothetical protein PRUPE_8G063000 [Prunus persica]